MDGWKGTFRWTSTDATRGVASIAIREGPRARSASMSDPAQYESAGTKVEVVSA